MKEFNRRKVRMSKLQERKFKRLKINNVRANKVVPHFRKSAIDCKIRIETVKESKFRFVVREFKLLSFC